MKKIVFLILGLAAFAFGADGLIKTRHLTCEINFKIRLDAKSNVMLKFKRFGK